MDYSNHITSQEKGKHLSYEVMLKQMNTEILIVRVQSIVQREKIGVKIYDSIWIFSW